MDEQCIHLLDPATCSICNGRDRRERHVAPSDWSHPFRAKYDGFCRGCHMEIDMGDMIVYNGEETRHEGCER